MVLQNMDFVSLIISVLSFDHHLVESAVYGQSWTSWQRQPDLIVKYPGTWIHDAVNLHNSPKASLIYLHILKWVSFLVCCPLYIHDQNVWFCEGVLSYNACEQLVVIKATFNSWLWNLTNTRIQLCRSTTFFLCSWVRWFQKLETYMSLMVCLTAYVFHVHYLNCAGQTTTCLCVVLKVRWLFPW